MLNDDSVEKIDVGATEGDSEPHPALRTAQERFSNHKEALTRLFDEDDEFRGLCDDYRDCIAYLERTVDPTPGSEALRKEYSALQLRLEMELLQYIEKAEATNTDGFVSDDEHQSNT